MEWNAEPPTREGHYWHRYSDQHRPSVLRVFVEDGFWSVRGENAFETFLDNVTGQWAGPIPQPTEPDDE